MNSRLYLTLVAGVAMALPGMAQSRYDRRQAMNLCKSEIRQQAMEEFGANRVYFPIVSIAQNSGGNDWITGTVQIGNGSNAQFQQFSCSANLYSGRVRSAQLQGMPPSANNQGWTNQANWAQPNNYPGGAVNNQAMNNQNSWGQAQQPMYNQYQAQQPMNNQYQAQAEAPCNCGSNSQAMNNQPMNNQPMYNQPVVNNSQAYGEASRDIDSMAIENCQSSAARQIRHDGYGNIRFETTNVAQQPYGDHVWGRARANGWYRAKTFSYSCSADTNGYVRHSDVAMH